MVLRGRGGGRGRAFSPWSRPLTSSSRFLSLPTKGLSGPSPGPLSHDPVSEETALSPCPQAPVEVTQETDTESQPPSTWTSLRGQRRSQAQLGWGPEEKDPHVPELPHSRLRWMDGVGVGDCVTTFRERV